MMKPHLPILCLDFDGVIHSYQTPWSGADNIPDPPVPGAMKFIAEAVNHFTVAVYSTRSNSKEGRWAMRQWTQRYMASELGSGWQDVYDALEWPEEKPPAFLTIDDRAMQFTGHWPHVMELRLFKPWNKQ